MMGRRAYITQKATNEAVGGGGGGGGKKNNVMLITETTTATTKANVTHIVIGSMLVIPML